MKERPFALLAARDWSKDNKFQTHLFYWRSSCLKIIPAKMLPPKSLFVLAWSRARNMLPLGYTKAASSPAHAPDGRRSQVQGCRETQLKQEIFTMVRVKKLTFDVNL